MFRKLRLPYTFLLVIILITSIAMNAQPFKVFGVSDLARVYEDGYNLPPSTDSLSIFGIKGEIISGQFALNSKMRLTNVTVDVSSFQDTKGNVIPEGNTEWDFVGSVLLPTNAPNQPKEVLDRLAPARFPDYLRQEHRIDIDKGKFQPVWLTIRIPQNASDGVYKGKITVTGDQGKETLPLILTVYPLTLPPDRHIKIAVRFSVSSFDKYHGIEEKYSEKWFAMLRKYAENMVEHRQNVLQAPMSAIKISRSASGELNFDFSLFDKIVQVFMNTGKMDYIETGYGLTRFGKDDWFSTVIELSDQTVRDDGKSVDVTLPGKDVVPFLLPAFERHLRQKGWLDKTLLSVRNEPSLHNALIYNELSDYFHHLTPDLKQFESIETTMYGGLDIPGPKLDHLATWYDSFKEAQEKGTEICYYIVGIYQGSRFPDKTIDLPVMDSRIMPWLNYKYNLSGIKHWGWNSWTDNPYNEVGQHLGDGWHVYPVKDGILNSLRWEEMRNGIQDYECFRLLENKILTLKDSLGSRFLWIDPRQRGVEISGKAVTNFAERTKDPSVLYNAKKELINEILDFDNSPGIYVQTNPVAGSALTAGSTVEVYGWTEPGTKIIINRREIPVNEDGLFLEQFGLSLRSNRIIVRAVKDDKSKEVIREFVVR
jgi:hypothetical protein